MDDFIVDGKAISELRVVDLKTQLEKRGLSKSGQKNVLAKRLRDHLALEKIQEESAGKDPNTAPNMEMKKCGSSVVAEYLERQQQALQAAKKAAQAVRAASSSSFDDTDPSQTPAGETLNESFNESVSSAKSSRADPTEGNGLSNAEKRADVTKKFNESMTADAQIEPVEIPLNLSKDETKLATAMDQGPEAKMAVEEPTTTTTAAAAAVNTGATAAAEPIAATIVENESTAADVKPESTPLAANREPFEKTLKLVRDVGDSRSSDSRSSSPSNDERREDDHRPAASGDEKSEPSADDDDDDNSNSRAPVVAEDGDEVEISAPQNIADELMEVSNAEKISDKRLSKEEPIVAPIVADVKEKPQRKRKWGSTTSGKRTTVSISSESLKEIVGPVTAAETTTTTLDDPVQLDYDEDPIPKRIVISREDMDEEDTVEDGAPAAVSKAKSHDKSETITPPVEAIFGDEGVIKVRSPSPARHPVNRIIHIRCLTRPFTQKALHDLCGTFGNFDKNEFWIDGIKSHCFIKYDTEEDATAARDKLDNAKWPSSNPHLLRVDFSNQDDLDRHRNKAKAAAATKRQDSQSSSQHPLVSKENHTDTNSKAKERVVREIRNDGGSISPIRDPDSKLWPKTREWDKGKDWKTGQSPPNADRSGRRRSPSPSSRRIDIHGKKEEVPAKLLDDLFRKTKTTPCIYWLPLTSDQALEKDKERKRKQEMLRAERPYYEVNDERDARRPRFDRERRYSPFRQRRF